MKNHALWIIYIHIFSCPIHPCKNVLVHHFFQPPPMKISLQWLQSPFFICQNNTTQVWKPKTSCFWLYTHPADVFSNSDTVFFRWSSCIIQQCMMISSSSSKVWIYLTLAMKFTPLTVSLYLLLYLPLLWLFFGRHALFASFSWPMVLVC